MTGGYGRRVSERLIARCYDAIRNGAGWKITLFIITYDEHGGIWDHVLPPAAVSPDRKRHDGFAFDRYGVRVPAVFVSPWIAPGTIARAPEDGPPFDHTSILSTLRALLGPFKPLTRRDAVAPDLLPVLSLDEPTNDGPRNLTFPALSSDTDQLNAVGDDQATEVQKALALVVKMLPTGVANIVEHCTQLAEAVPAEGIKATDMSAREALAQAKQELARFLHGIGSLAQ